MKRRELLKNIGLGYAAFVSIPVWAKNWKVDMLPASKAFQNEAILKSMIDTLIPKSDTPGALEQGVDKYVKAMLQAMHTAQEQKDFEVQLGKVDDVSKKISGKGFIDNALSVRLEILKSISQESATEWKRFYRLFRNYSIQGYTGSEWYMTNVAGYVMAPGFSKGCVNV